MSFLKMKKSILDEKNQNCDFHFFFKRILGEGNVEDKCNPDIISKIMLRCIYGCQKWIPDKILHRNDNSIFFSTHFFQQKFSF